MLLAPKKQKRASISQTTNFSDVQCNIHEKSIEAVVVETVINGIKVPECNVSIWCSCTELWQRFPPASLSIGHQMALWVMQEIGNQSENRPTYQ